MPTMHVPTMQHPPAESSKTAHRVSLACLQCRSRHTKCDAAQPVCGRCTDEGQACTYTKSRRRGHRRAKVPDERTPHSGSVDSSISPASVSPGTRVRGRDITRSRSAAPATDPGTGTSLAPDSSVGGASAFSWTALDGIDTGDCSHSDLIDRYYEYFHRSHPCALPRWALNRYYEAEPLAFSPIILAMQYIGSIFEPTISSEPYLEMVVASLPSPQQIEVITPHQIQAMVLYSIAAYWCDEVEKSYEVMSLVIRRALQTDMHMDHFAFQMGKGDPVLEESWRRTWWQIYATEAHVAGSTHTFPTRISHIDNMNACLPCEEADYESGKIPTPRTLREYDIREFLSEEDIGFSSFAHLVGLTRTMDLVFSQNMPLINNIPNVCKQADISVSAWCSLLPLSKRHVLKENREVDTQLFKAFAIVNTYIVDLHRQLSDLYYSSIESVARCAPPPPPQPRNTASPNPTTNLHTTKALLAIRRFSDLIPLPPNIVTHTPFLICMIANTMVAHLSACRYLFRGKALQLERERVRAGMGALRRLGECWPLGKRTYQEMGVIAREILCLTDEDISRGQGRIEPRSGMSESPMQHLTLDAGTNLFDFQGLSQEMLDSYAALQPMDCGSLS